MRKKALLPGAWLPGSSAEAATLPPSSFHGAHPALGPASSACGPRLSALLGAELQVPPSGPAHPRAVARVTLSV